MRKFFAYENVVRFAVLIAAALCLGVETRADQPTALERKFQQLMKQSENKPAPESQSEPQPEPETKPEPQFESQPETENQTSKKRRVVAVFAQSHLYNPTTGFPEEDPLCETALTCINNVLTVSLRYGQYDNENYVAVAGRFLTRENVKRVFEALANDTRPGDEIFIYWFGHGNSGLPTNDPNETDSNDEFLLTYEFYMVRTKADVRKYAIVDDEMGEWVAKLQGRRVVMVFESCHSGGLTTSDRTARNLADYRPVRLQGKTLKALNDEIAFEVERQYVCGASDLTKYAAMLAKNAKNAKASKSTGSVANPSFGRGFLEALKPQTTGRTKDISPDQENLCVAFACQENEKAWAHFIEEVEDKYEVCALAPLAFAYCYGMTKPSDGETLFFDEFAALCTTVAEETVRCQRELTTNPEDFSEQHPTFIMNMNDALLRPKAVAE